MLFVKKTKKSWFW